MFMLQLRLLQSREHWLKVHLPLLFKFGTHRNKQGMHYSLVTLPYDIFRKKCARQQKRNRNWSMFSDGDLFYSRAHQKVQSMVVHKQQVNSGIDVVDFSNNS